MITKLIELYLIINYSGQKIGNPWNVKQGLINIILMEISFLISGIFMGFYALFGFRSLHIILILLLLLILLIWKYGERRIKTEIDFVRLESVHTRLKKSTRIIYFIISLLLIFFCVFSMFYLIKLVLMLK